MKRGDWHGALRFFSFYRLCVALLGIWALGLAATAVQLQAWQYELTTTLTQMRTDAQFRARAAQHRGGADPQWYRNKALSLLSAAETLRDDTLWTLFVPGSWHVFDDVEERTAARIEQEFGAIVVETVRRELLARAGACGGALPEISQRRLSASLQDQAEYGALRDYLARLEPLDGAVHAFLQLQHAPVPDPEQLRSLLTFTLGVEPPGPLTRSVRLFRDTADSAVPAAAVVGTLQAATRCSLLKGMGALHTRLLAGNDLFTLEEALAQHSAGLFERNARPARFERTVERYRAVLAVLDDQELLLSRGGHDWMRAPTLQLGDGYDEMLRRVAGSPLLGPDVAAQVRAASGVAFAQFRSRFQRHFGQPERAGIAWSAEQHRFTLSAERAALRDGLSALLQESFMGEESAPVAPSLVVFDLTGAVMEAQSLLDARTRFQQDTLLRFPPGARPAVARVVDARLAELAYERAFRAVKASLPDDALPDPFSFRLQRQQVVELQSVLRRMGAGGLGQRLADVQLAELARVAHAQGAPGAARLLEIQDEIGRESAPGLLGPL